MPELSSADVTQLQELLDRDAIRQVYEQYFHGIDRRDWATVRACFYDDASERIISVADLQNDSADGPQVIFDGSIDKWTNWSQGLHETRSFAAHLPGPTRITLKGDVAETETTALTIQRGLPPDDGIAIDLVACGLVQDTLHKREGVWKIARRDLQLMWARHEPAPAGQAHRQTTLT